MAGDRLLFCTDADDVLTASFGREFPGLAHREHPLVKVSSLQSL